MVKIRFNLKNRFIAFLKQGLTPHELALCVALGCVISVVPMLGTTSLLCALVAGSLSLNQPAMQSVNWVLYPLQFLLLIPWYKLGATLFHAPAVHWTGQEVKTLIHAGLWSSIKTLWTVTWHAVIAWGMVAPVAGVILYFALKPIFKRLANSSVRK